MFGMYVFSALGGMGTMSDEFKDLAQVAADAVVSAMAADSHEVAKRRFAAHLGRDRQLESTHADLAAMSGRDLPRARSEQARDWKTCAPLWQHGNGFTTGGSPVIAGGVLFVNAPGNGDVDAFSL
jgi:hypothetical protein